MKQDANETRKIVEEGKLPPAPEPKERENTTSPIFKTGRRDHRRGLGIVAYCYMDVKPKIEFLQDNNDAITAVVSKCIKEEKNTEKE